MAWFDIGVNLLDSRLDPQVTIANAKQQGVDRLCVITTNPNEWQVAADLYRQYPSDICYTVGIHPHNAKSMRDDLWSELERAAQQPGVVAIGECGLDYNRDFSPRDIQRSVFEQQLALAAALGKPVYLHERDALEDQLTILDRHLPSISAGVLHCFTADKSVLAEYLARDLYVGITGWICDEKRGGDLRDAVSAIPLDRILMETDAPYLFPKTKRPRAKNNEPAFLPFIGQEVARLMNVTETQLSEHSYRNACTLFGIGE